MNLPEFTDNVNIHQSLPDQPALTPLQLKIEWDKGVSLIKKYLNEVLLPALNKQIPKEFEELKTKILKEVDIKLAEKEEEILSSVNTTKEDLESQMITLKNEVNTKVANAIATAGNATVLTSTTPKFVNSTEIWSRLSKRNNDVHLFAQFNGHIEGGQSKVFIELPEGYRPKNTHKGFAIGLGASAVNGFTFISTCTIESNGNVTISAEGNQIGADSLIVQAMFPVD